MSEKIVSTEWIVPETTALDALIIEPGGSVKAPEGKQLTLTVNGIGADPAPGRYEGGVVLTVTEQYDYHTLLFGQPKDVAIRAGICVIDGKYRPEYSVPSIVQGGSVQDGKLSNVAITSNEWDFTGILLSGNGDYEISDAKITLTGDGTNDFVGLGAAITAHGKVNLTVNDSNIRTYGITRGVLCSTEETVVTLNDCYLETKSYVPTDEQLEAGAKLHRMMDPPWMMGMRGNGRATNLVGKSTAYYNRCHVVSNSWGVLSVDGAIVNRMFVKDSLVELKGDSGYGCFCIADDTTYDYASLGDEPGCFNVIDHSIFNVATCAIVMCCGTAGSEFKNGAEVNSALVGAYIFRNCGLIKVNSRSAFRTGKASFLVQGANSRIEVDDAILEPENGVILCLIDNDDPGHEGGPAYNLPLGEIDEPIPGRDLTVADPGEDIFMTISNMETAGDLYNATTNLKANTRVYAPNLESPMPGPGQIRGMKGDDLQGAKNLDLKLVNAKLTGAVSSAINSYRDGVTKITQENREEFFETTQTAAPPVNNGIILSLDEKSVWTVTSTSYLTSLTLAPGARIKAPGGKKLVLTANGDPIDGPGTFNGLIIAEVL